MRLIDADRLKEVFNRNVVSANVWNEIIDMQPTAYDVDKVVEEIKQECISVMNKRYPEDECNMHSKGAQELFLKAEKILKGAVKE